MKNILGNICALFIITISVPIIALAGMLYYIPVLLLGLIDFEWEPWGCVSKMGFFINGLSNRFFDY